jgi:hypothetical protein
MGESDVLGSREVIKTYRYLRIGMIGSVVLLAASIAIERTKVDCFQTSISAYYYTPVRAIFVGAMMAVGFALIVYKGRGIEDAFLNFAGMLAPIVAVAPTTDVGRCWSTEPSPRPVMDDGSLAGWVVANIDNNVRALLVTGALGLALAILIAVIVKRSLRAPAEWERGTSTTLLLTGVVLVFAWWCHEQWDDFNTRAHGFAAAGMFVFLILAIVVKVVQQRRERNTLWFWVYAATAALMIVGGVAIPTTRVFGEHTVFALETYEIVLFAVYWAFATIENWDERVVPSGPSSTVAVAASAAQATPPSTS